MPGCCQSVSQLAVGVVGPGEVIHLLRDFSMNEEREGERERDNRITHDLPFAKQSPHKIVCAKEVLKKEFVIRFLPMPIFYLYPKTVLFAIAFYVSIQNRAAVVDRFAFT